MPCLVRGAQYCLFALLLKFSGYTNDRIATGPNGPAFEAVLDD
ncbi:hypothetical protein CEV34_1235 [Brucella pseudogrignonensis]|uniref:Uncharacterized protein n=1 Tax=Brucella pseudogrignonensis TaxID=419475 RepID=A0A256GM50_9HYPH|nr:hypothetical protein CEV34_1235 [Brucella pseudogrignonensis]